MCLCVCVCVCVGGGGGGGTELMNALGCAIWLLIWYQQLNYLIWYQQLNYLHKKELVSYRGVYEKLEYFENISPNLTAL